MLVSAISAVRSAPLTIEVRDLQQILADAWSPLLNDWNTLLRADAAAVMAQQPDYLAEELRALDREHLPALWVACRRGTQLVALGLLVPKATTLKKLGGFGSVGTLHGYRLAGNQLLGDGNTEAQQMLWSEIQQQVIFQRATFLLVEDLNLESSFGSLVRTPARQGRKFFAYSRTGSQEHWRIKVPATAEEYWNQQFSAKTRSTFRRQEKKVPDLRYERITEPDQVANFLEQANRVSQHTWQSAELGLRIRNDDLDHRLYTLLALQGVLRSYLMFSGDEPIAFLIGNQFQQRFNYEEVGFDQRWSRHSAGRLLLRHVLDDLWLWQRPEWFDFGSGEADYKRQFGNTSHQSESLHLFTPSLRGWAIARYLSACRSGRITARSLVRRLRRKTVSPVATTAPADNTTAEGVIQ